MVRNQRLAPKLMLFNFEGMLPAKRGSMLQMGGAVQTFSVRGRKVEVWEHTGAYVEAVL